MEVVCANFHFHKMLSDFAAYCESLVRFVSQVGVETLSEPKVEVGPDRGARSLRSGYIFVTMLQIAGMLAT